MTTTRVKRIAIYARPGVSNQTLARLKRKGLFIGYVDVPYLIGLTDMFTYKGDTYRMCGLAAAEKIHSGRNLFAVVEARPHIQTDD